MTSRWLKLFYSFIFLWLCLMTPTTASVAERRSTSHNLSSNNNETASNLICSPFGACEPCPPDALNQPFCRPFGNRRLVHCVNATESHTTSAPPSHSTTVHTNFHEAHPPPEHDSPEHPSKEILAWESCGRIVPKERADFYEFMACNLVFAVLSLGVLFFRSRRLQVMQARQLAARIGLFREDGRVTRI